MTRLPGPRAQARAPAATTSSASTRSRRCARPPRPQQLRDVRGLRARRSRRRCSRRFAAGVGEAPRAARAAAPRARRSARRSSRRCARTRRATASSSPARARRLADAVKDLDIIATADDPPALLARARRARRSIESRRSARRERRRAARTHTGMEVDLRVVEPDQFGNLLQHFTGSKAHNVALREAAVRRGLHVSEYGILDDATGETLRCATEEEVYERLGLPWIPPELREDRGELEPRRRRRCRSSIDAGRPARRPALPHDRLRRAQHARGDGARRARERGYEYLAITDHSATHGFGNHVTPDAAARARSSASASSTTRSTASRCWSGPRRTSCPTARSTTTTSCSPSSTGSIASVHTSFGDGASGDDRAHGRRHRAPAGRRDRPPDRPQDRDARALRARHRRASSRRPRAPARCSRSTRRPTAATSTTSTRAPPRAAGRADPDRLRRARRQHAAATCAGASRPRAARG